MSSERLEIQVDTLDVIEELAGRIANHLPRRIPLSVDLWSHAEIALYLKVSARQVAERYAPLPGFPAAYRIPARGPGRGHPRYKASDVIAWAESHKETR
jgi:hypothetical protein